MINRLTLDLRGFYAPVEATTVHRTDPHSIPRPTDNAQSRLTLQFTSPDRTALSTTFSEMDAQPYHAKMDMISEVSRTSQSIGAHSSEQEEYEMQRMKGRPYASAVWLQRFYNSYTLHACKIIHTLHTYFIAQSLLHSYNLLHRIDRIDNLAEKKPGCDRIHLFERKYRKLSFQNNEGGKSCHYCRRLLYVFT